MNEAPKLPLEDNGLCFGCGHRNPIGLRLTFFWDGNTYNTRYLPETEHQGWAGRTHGGMIALVLDEVLSRAALEQYGLDWVTAELTTRLLRPAPVGEPLLVRGWVVTVRSKMILCAGEVIDEKTGTVVARGQAKMMRPLKDANSSKGNQIMEETSQVEVETPMERAARIDSDPAKDSIREEAEANAVVADIDDYVAQTDPGSLSAAEEQLNAWEIPQDIAETDAPGDSDGKLVSVLAAHSESEANIVAGILNAVGIPATFDNSHSPILGDAMSSDSSSWADVLVPEGMAEAARAAIAEAIQPQESQASDPG